MNSQWCDDHNRCLGKENDVEDLPVAERLQDPGLDGAANSESHGQTEVADQAPLLHGDILESCKDIKF